MQPLQSRLPARALAVALLAVLLAGVGATPASARGKRFTHHGDPASAFPRGKKKLRPTAKVSTLGPFNTSSWPCTEQTQDLPDFWSNAPQVKVIYVYPTDWSSRLRDGTYNYGNLIQADAAAVRTKVATTAGSQRSVRFDVGGTGGGCTGNGGQYLDIQSIALDNDVSFYNNGNDDYAYYRIRDELRQKLTQPAEGRRIDYIVYADGISPKPGVAGEATRPSDASKSLENVANQGYVGKGEQFAIVYGELYGGTADFNGYGASIRQESMLHELTHNMGGVQDGAPHASGNAHCYDGNDIMCYNDGGSYFQQPGNYLLGPADTGCSGSGIGAPYDCNNDDYFNPNPPAGSYLASHWNSYDSVFLCPVDDCDAPATPPSVASITQSAPGGPVTLTANVTSDKPITHYEWDVDGDGFYDVDTGTTPVLQPEFESDTARTVWMRASKADGSFRLASLANVQPITPQAALDVRGDRTIGSVLQLDGSATQDPEGYITHFRWDLDGDNSYETDTGLERTTTVSFAQPQSVSLGLEVDYPWGFSFARAPIFSILGPKAATPLVSPLPAPKTVVFAEPTLALSKISLRSLFKHGQPLTVKCGAPCTVHFSLSIDSRTARKFGLKSRHGRPVVIGRLTGQFAAGIARPAIKVTPASVRALKRARKLTVSISGRVAQGASTPLRLAKALVYKR